MSSIKFRNGASFVAITADMMGAASKDHTHNYAGSETPGGAASSAVKLTTNGGTPTQPAYISNGVPRPCTYTLCANVPYGAVFTDTNTHTVYKQSSQPSDDVCLVWIKPSGIATGRPMVYFRSD